MQTKRKRSSLLLFSTHLTLHSDKLFIDSIIITYTKLHSRSLDNQVDDICVCLPIYNNAVNFFRFFFYISHLFANYFFIIHSRETHSGFSNSNVKRQRHDDKEEYYSCCFFSLHRNAPKNICIFLKNYI